MKTTLHIDGKPVVLENVVRGAQEISFTLGGKSYRFRGERLPDGDFILERESRRRLAAHERRGMAGQRLAAACSWARWKRKSPSDPKRRQRGRAGGAEPARADARRHPPDSGETRR